MHRRAKLDGNLAEGDRNAARKRVRRAAAVSKEIASLARRRQKAGCDFLMWHTV